MTHLFLFLMLVIGSVLQSGVPAEAALVTYQFSGSLTNVPTSLHTPGGLGANGFDAGLKLSGTYTFDTMTPGVFIPPLPPGRHPTFSSSGMPRRLRP